MCSSRVAATLVVSTVVGRTLIFLVRPAMWDKTWAEDRLTDVFRAINRRRRWWRERRRKFPSEQRVCAWQGLRVSERNVRVYKRIHHRRTPRACRVSPLEKLSPKVFSPLFHFKTRLELPLN